VVKKKINWNLVQTLQNIIKVRGENVTPLYMDKRNWRHSLVGPAWRVEELYSTYNNIVDPRGEVYREDLSWFFMTNKDSYKSKPLCRGLLWIWIQKYDRVNSLFWTWLYKWRILRIEYCTANQLHSFHLTQLRECITCNLFY
jgi:hypothetical protein